MNLVLFYFLGVVVAVVATNWFNTVVKQTPRYKRITVEEVKQTMLLHFCVIFFSWGVVAISLVVTPIICVVEGVQFPLTAFLKKITNCNVD